MWMGIKPLPSFVENDDLEIKSVGVDYAHDGIAGTKTIE